jgi:hypothetical protein
MTTLRGPGGDASPVPAESCGLDWGVTTLFYDAAAQATTHPGHCIPDTATTDPSPRRGSWSW